MEPLGGGARRQTPTPTQHHPLAELAAVEPLLPRATATTAAAAEEAAAASASSPSPGQAHGKEALVGVPAADPTALGQCAACHFLVGDARAVRALGRAYHPECFRCAVCAEPLFFAAGPADREDQAAGGSGPLSLLSSSSSRRLRLGSLGQEGGEDDEEEDALAKGDAVTFLQLRDLPLCRRHFLEQLAMMEADGDDEDEEEAFHDTAPPPNGLPPSTACSLSASSSASSSSSSGGSFATASPGSPAKVPQQHVEEDKTGQGVRFESSSSRSPPPAPPPLAFHSADGGGLPLPPALSPQGSPRSAALRRTKSATVFGRQGSGAEGPPDTSSKRRRASLLAVASASRETAEERDARLLRLRDAGDSGLPGHPFRHRRRPTSVYHLPALDDGISIREPEKQQQLKQQPPPPSPLPPLTVGSALSFGIRAAAAEGEKEGEGEEGEEDEGIFTARRQVELSYGGGEGDDAAAAAVPATLFYWEEVAPRVFAKVRELFGVTPQAYAASMGRVEGGVEGGGVNSSSSSSNGSGGPVPVMEGAGKSGSSFFRSHDNTLVVKTVAEGEHAFLLATLRDYLDVMVHRGGQSLLPRFFGLYGVKLPGKPAVRLLVMKNVFHRPLPQLRITAKYDLKGSLIKRYVPPPQTDTPAAFSGNNNSSPGIGGATAEGSPRRRSPAWASVPVQKDLNFCGAHDGTDDLGHEFKGSGGGGSGNSGGTGQPQRQEQCRTLRLGPARKKELLSYLAADVEWLRRRGVMDFSLLVGVCVLTEARFNRRLHSLWLAEEDAAAGGLAAGAGAAAMTTGASTPPPLSSSSSSPAAAAASSSSSSSLYRTREAYLVGIVDILQTYTFKRRLETLYKTGVVSFEGRDPRSLTVVEPDAYARRFLDFIERHLA